VSADIVEKRGRWISEFYQRHQRFGDATLKRIARAFAETAESRSHGAVGSQTIAEACSAPALTLDACSARPGREQTRAPAKLANFVLGRRNSRMGSAGVLLEADREVAQAYFLKPSALHTTAMRSLLL